jgi:hypothetical protein
MRMPALLLVIGAIGAVIAARLIVREWQRVNGELEQARAKPARARAGDDRMTDLRRDPKSGVYRPDR